MKTSVRLTLPIVLSIGLCSALSGSDITEIDVRERGELVRLDEERVSELRDLHTQELHDFRAVYSYRSQSRAYANTPDAPGVRTGKIVVARHEPYLAITKMETLTVEDQEGRSFADTMTYTWFFEYGEYAGMFTENTLFMGLPLVLPGWIVPPLTFTDGLTIVSAQTEPPRLGRMASEYARAEQLGRQLVPHEARASLLRQRISEPTTHPLGQLTSHNSFHFDDEALIFREFGIEWDFDTPDGVVSVPAMRLAATDWDGLLPRSIQYISVSDSPDGELRYSAAEVDAAELRRRVLDHDPRHIWTHEWYTLESFAAYTAEHPVKIGDIATEVLFVNHGDGWFENAVPRYAFGDDGTRTEVITFDPISNRFLD